MALLPTLSVEHHQRLLDLARAQHVETRPRKNIVTVFQAAPPGRGMPTFFKGGVLSKKGGDSEKAWVAQVKMIKQLN